MARLFRFATLVFGSKPVIGRMVISGTLSILSFRIISFGVGLLLTALIFKLSGSDNPLLDASPWWPVYGLLANYLSFIVLRRQLIAEKSNWMSLINYQRNKLRADLLNGLQFILVSIVLAVASSIAFGFLLYGRYPNELMLPFHGIPLSVQVASFIIFPIVNSTLEEMTFNGYAYPRLEAGTNNKWVAILILLFFFTIQHVFITFKPDLRYMVWRLLSFVPLLLCWILIYIRMRRLTTLIPVHWFMDTFGILSIVFGTD